MNKKTLVKMALGVFVGGALGFAYYYFIGCRSGACPITSSPLVSTAYGSLVGGLLAFGK